MKKTIITILFATISLIGIAQPKAVKEAAKPLATELKDSTFKVQVTHRQDTLVGNFIVFDKEGYLQRQRGKVYRKIKEYANNIMSPAIESEVYILDNGTTVRREDIFDFRPDPTK